jgi:hypothetical protein
MTDKPKFGVNLYPTEPTYTAAEVKVLTEAALRLGRKEAGEDIAAACMERAVESEYGLEESAFVDAAGIARQISARALTCEDPGSPYRWSDGTPVDDAELAANAWDITKGDT